MAATFPWGAMWEFQWKHFISTDYVCVYICTVTCLDADYLSIAEALEAQMHHLLFNRWAIVLSVKSFCACAVTSQL